MQGVKKHGCDKTCNETPDQGYLDNMFLIKQMLVMYLFKDKMKLRTPRRTYLLLTT